ncbi:MAG: ABC transporter transmembrane domain-containing protein, partial [bacterium]|nr:ABC transporter transmembrane domain-containing protein [bacterium]
TRAHLGAGMALLVVGNYYDIRLAVLIGTGIDLLKADMSRVAGLQMALLVFFILMVFGLGIGSAAARFWMRRLMINASRHIEFDLRNDFFMKLVGLPPAFYDRYRTGDLMSRATSDVDAIRTVIGPSIMYLVNTIAILPMTLVQMFHISVPLTALCWLPMLLIAPVFYFFSHGIHFRSRRAQELMSDLTANIQETISGARVVKVYARESDRVEQFDGLSRDYIRQSMALARLQAIFIPMLRLLVGMTVLLLLWGGSYLIIHGRLGIGALVTFFLLLMSSIWPMAAFGWVLAQL